MEFEESQNQNGEQGESRASEVRLCLIGGFHQKSDSRPSYCEPWLTPDGVTVSVDMVRIELGFNDKSWAIDDAETLPGERVETWTQHEGRPGSYRVVRTFFFADGCSSATLGVGLYDKNRKAHPERGFIEFNPNKVCGDGQFIELLKKLSGHVSTAEVKRYDLALDVPVERMHCRLSKDRRKYSTELSGSLTEYLGVRNTPGYVKAYDKGAEQGFSDDVKLTRIEMTCDGEWSAQQVRDRWPKVGRWSTDRLGDAPARARNWLEPFGMMAERLAELGQDVERYLSMLDWYRKGQAREFLLTDVVELPDGAPEYAILQVEKWANALRA